MRTFKLAFILCLGLVASACSPQAEARPSLRIALSPAALPASAAVSACLQRVQDVSVSIEVRHSSVVNLEDLAFYIQLGEAEEEPGFAAQVATENVVIVVHPSNQLEFSLAQVADLFSGRVQNWSEVGGEEAAVNLWVGAESDESRMAFEARILRGSPVAGSAQLATNPEDLLAAVAADPAAAGILPAAWVDATVQAIEIGIELPVLALAAEEPSGAGREVLACLQGGVGQAELGKLYAGLEQ